MSDDGVVARGPLYVVAPEGAPFPVFPALPVAERLART